MSIEAKHSRAKRVYLAGPMTGIPHFNYPAFIEGAKRLRAAGHEVFSPVEHNDKTHGDMSNAAGSNEQAAKEHGFDLRKALGADLAWICAEADAVALLPGWENSRGANAERATAIALGLDVFEIGPAAHQAAELLHAIADELEKPAP